MVVKVVAAAVVVVLFVIDVCVCVCVRVSMNQVYSLSRNGQLFVFQCDTELSDIVDADQHQDVSASSSDDDVEPDQVKKRKGYKQTLSLTPVDMTKCTGCGRLTVRQPLSNSLAT